MAAYKFLKDLTIGEHKDSIKVRVSREWDWKKTGSKHVTRKNYLLLDEEGSQVQAITSQHSLIAWITKQIENGNVYMITGYSVEHASDKYRPVSGEYVINFNRQTKVNNLNDIPTIPRYKFDITTFESAISRAGDVFTLMDVVGKLSKYTPLQTPDGGKRRLEIVLANERNEEMKMTLWETQADDFIQLRPEYHGKPDSLVIVTSVTTKLVKEEYVLWSSSSTQFFFNIDHPAIISLRGNSNMKGDLVPEIVPVLESPNQTAKEDIKKLTIEQLFDVQLPVGKDAIAFLAEATVFGVLPEYGWYYMGCGKCTKKVNELQQCTKCPDNKLPPVPRYRVTAEVEDTTSNTTFVLFDRHVVKMINVSAQHILNNDENASQDLIPPILNNMLGRRYIFKLNLTSHNTVKKKEDFTVTQVEEVQPAELDNAHPLPLNLDVQMPNSGNGQNLEHHLGAKRKPVQDDDKQQKQPASSAIKETTGKQNRNKRTK